MVQEYLNTPLRERNSFGIDARAARLAEFDSAESLCEYLARTPRTTGRTAVIGGGNNILFTGDFDGLLLHPVGRACRIDARGGDRVAVHAEAGLPWDDFVRLCTENGLWGAENLTAIPGTVGAAPVQNIGAYGAEAADIIESVEVIDLNTLKPSIIAAEHCAFGYRESVFKGPLRGRVVITAVNFRLSRTPHPNLGYGALAAETAALGEPSLENITEAVRRIRASKLPDPALIGNAGSFFKNPVVEQALAERLRNRFPEMPSYATADPDRIKIPAGWLIEKAGWKGVTRNRAGVYERQALILVNRGGASGADIIALAEAIIADVQAKFGITIAPEVNIW